jgi:hypothetical protein
MAVADQSRKSLEIVFELFSVGDTRASRFVEQT